ncbi:MAG: hypothetical protein Q9167_001376 [Letrouitia subvulpina]
MKLDPAIARALSLDSKTTSVATHGSSGFNATAKISTTLKDGTQKNFFLKTAHGEGAGIMFRGEHASLNAIHSVVPTLCPASLATGRSDDGAFFLATDFLDLSARSSAAGSDKSSGMSLAAKLGKLHTTPAPPAPGHSKAMFGFEATTCCGDTAQPNDFRSSWADFYAQNRLLAVLHKCERSNGKNAEFRSLVQQTVDKVVPRLIGDDHLNDGNGVTPVVVHGDLWSGNKGRGQIGGRGGIEEVIFDPSAVYGHSEYELGIMNMFGGFGKTFFDEYHRICPKTPPVEEYSDRVSLYELSPWNGWMFYVDVEKRLLPLDVPIISIARYFVSRAQKEGFVEQFRAVEHFLGEYVAPKLEKYGWRIDNEGSGKEECVLFAGWDDVESHYAFAKTQRFEGFSKIRKYMTGAEIKHAMGLDL